MTSQTFLDLYRELKARAYTTRDLELVFKAHELASRLFAGSYRPTYKPFICHLVGTASVLGRHKERAELIAAALLHSAYALGDFGDETREITARKRQAISDWVGAAVEDLVYRYHTADWHGFDHTSPDANGIERDLLALKFADLFDDVADNTMRIVPGKGLVGHPAENAAVRQTLIENASRTLGPEMGREFESLFEAIEREEIDDFLVNERKASFFERRKPLAQPSRPRWRRIAARARRAVASLF